MPVKSKYPSPSVRSDLNPAAAHHLRIALMLFEPLDHLAKLEAEIDRDYARLASDVRRVTDRLFALAAKEQECPTEELLAMLAGSHPKGGR